MSSNSEPIDSGDGGSESDAATIAGIDFSAFLEDAKAINGVDFQSASGIKPVRVAQAVIATIGFAIAYGVNSFIEAASQAASRAIEGVSGFIADGLIGSTFGVASSAIEGAWSFAVDQFGIAAFLFAIAAIIATFYVASWGLNTAEEVLLG